MKPQASFFSFGVVVAAVVLLLLLGRSTFPVLWFFVALTDFASFVAFGRTHPLDEAASVASFAGPDPTATSATYCLVGP